MTLTPNSPLVAVVQTDRGGTFCAPAVLTRAEVSNLVNRDLAEADRRWLCTSEPEACTPGACPHPAIGRRHWTFRR